MKATAYIVESGTVPDPDFIRSMKSVGFSDIRPYRDLSEVETRMAETPICYFLFPHSDDSEAIGEVVHRLRGCKRRNVRFSPLIYFCQDPSRDLIHSCVSLGFDDVITMPRGANELAARIGYQVGHPTVYFETPHYFGPDRRNDGRLGDPKMLSRDAQLSYNRFEFVRDAQSGISITARQASAA